MIDKMTATDIGKDSAILVSKAMDKQERKITMRIEHLYSDLNIVFLKQVRLLEFVVQLLYEQLQQTT